MKTIIAASALALMTSTSAFATGPMESANIDQIAVGIQQALNDISDVTAAVDVEQDAVNAANLVNLTDAQGLDSISQWSWLKQEASNSLTGFLPTISDVSQSATNVVNSISLDTADVLDDIVQSAKIDQTAANDIAVAYKITDVSQEAVNAANLITVDASPDLEDIEQVAVGHQSATNSIQFKLSIDGNALDDDDMLIPSAQSATNVANSATVDKVSKTLSQFSLTGQTASNTADSILDGWGYGFSKIWDLDQSAVNAANLVQIGEINDSLDISQVAFAGQLATNGIDVNGTVTNVTQSATNVANSIGNISAE